ncbi:MAG: CRISPR-associated endonuclease Cas6 [Cytophagales bacterium]|nr:CRISPR-associated endonuclease Cas6 [Bernardetiaceae bacterium]MDW8211058.1 CRISPR-associated endonuclease Cas6 [Cytophagales bacterium]
MLLALPYLRIGFNAFIEGRDIPLFRGAIAQIAGYDHVLFHNHTEEGFRYAYPLIQYKQIRNKLSIVCVGEGTEEISYLFRSGKPYRLRIGEKHLEMSIEILNARKHPLQVWNSMISYRICRWFPFNSETYQAYRQKTTDQARRELLEATLRGQIMAFAKGVGWRLPSKEERPIICRILHLSEPVRHTVRQARLIAFNATFETNVSLPNFIGLGRHVSIGYGVISQLQKEEELF